MRTIIGLTGVKTSGKTTSFDLLKEMLGDDVREIQLAKKLKDVSSKVFGIDREAFDDPARKEVLLETPIYLDRNNLIRAIKAFGLNPDYDKHVRDHVGTVLETPRRVAQYIGTDVLRAIKDDIHCVAATEDLPENGFFIVTDMRFLNEYEFFDKTYVNGKEFFPFFIQSNRAEANSNDMHPSERQVLETAKRCKRVENNGSIPELKENLSKALIPMFKALAAAQKAEGKTDEAV